jgi:hypothetical protein
MNDAARTAEELEAAIRTAVREAKWNHLKNSQVKSIVETALLKEGIS